MVGVIAGEAALSVKEATSGFIEKGMEKAHEARYNPTHTLVLFNTISAQF